jgi:hypothetical protein
MRETGDLLRPLRPPLRSVGTDQERRCTKHAAVLRLLQLLLRLIRFAPVEAALIHGWAGPRDLRLGKRQLMAKAGLLSYLPRLTIFSIHPFVCMCYCWNEHKLRDIKKGGHEVKRGI